MAKKKTKKVKKKAKNPEGIRPGADGFGQPLDSIRWVSRDQFDPNEYNPNTVFPVELNLLQLSILTTGWTQPIVVCGPKIVDGYHRWLISDRPKMRDRFGGFIPVVEVDLDEVQLRAATVRHNRARGMHGVLAMSKIVKELLDHGVTREKIATELGMEKEEVNRLLDSRTMPEIAGDKVSWGRAWRPKR